MAPNSVILDTHESVKRLVNFTAHENSVTWHFFVLQVLEDIVDCAHNVKTFQRELRRLMEDINRGKYKNHTKEAADGRLAAAVHEVALTVFEQLKAVGAYLPDGLLPYYFYPVQDRYFHDMLLLKIHELP